MEVGTQVIRTSGETYQIGDRGQVLATDGQRVRVLWAADNKGTHGKRTWVRLDVVRPV